MKTTYFFIGAMFAAVGCGAPPAAQQSSSAAGGASQGVAKAVAVRVVKKNLLRTTEQPAQVVAWESAPLYSKVAAYVERIEKDRNIGDAVAAGDTLAVLRAPELNAEVDQKTALVTQADYGIKQAEAGVKVAGAAVTKVVAMKAELQAGVNRAEAENNRATLEFKRVGELVGQGSLTNKLAEEAESKSLAATATLAEAKARLESADAVIAEAEAQQARAVADLEAARSAKTAAEADLATAQAKVGYLTITSLLDGVITVRNVDPGHFVAPASGESAKPLFVVAKTDKLRVRFEVPEVDAPLLNAGDKASIRIQAFGDLVIPDAKVARTATSIDAATGTMRAEIDLETPQAGLRPGLYANVAVELDAREAALVLPASALFVKDGKTACVVIADGKAVVRTVLKGLTAGTEVEILPEAASGEGLKEGDLVVAKNGSTIAAGQAIEGIEAK